MLWQVTFLFHVLLFDLPLIENFDGHFVLCENMLGDFDLHNHWGSLANIYLPAPFLKHSQHSVMLWVKLPFQRTHYPVSCPGDNLPGRTQGSGAWSECLIPHHW